MLRERRVSTAHRLRTATLVAVVATILAVSPAVAWAGETGLGAIGFGAVAVDSTREHVFVSGPKANVVDVLNFSGKLIATIPNIYGADGMVIEGDTLFVAEGTDGTVVQINLTTLATAGSPLVTKLEKPRWLAIAGGALWVTTNGCCGWGRLDSVSLKSHAVKQFRTEYYEPDLATSPADPDELFVAEEGVSPGSVYRLNVTGRKLKVAAKNTSTNQQNIRDLAVSPDGTRVIPASGAPYDFEELSARTLKPDGVIYPGEAYPSAVAVSGPEADLLATGIASASGPDIRVDPIGIPSPIFEATTHSSAYFQSIPPHGLALSANGQMLFAASFSDSEETETLLNTYELP
jgi:hypothetical protein